MVFHLGNAEAGRHIPGLIRGHSWRRLWCSLYRQSDAGGGYTASGCRKRALDVGAASEIKIGQGAKPGIGGHLPREKVTEDVSRTRMIPVGTDALSPAPQHDIYSIEDLRQLIFALKEATDYAKPVSVKIAAVHNSAAIASGMVRAGADIIVLDGKRGATGAAPRVIRDNVGIPIELALASVDQRLRDEARAKKRHPTKPKSNHPRRLSLPSTSQPQRTTPSSPCK